VIELAWDAEAAAQPPGVAVVRDLLARLHEADLAYCHWKSNEHLGAALDGMTDLDILVERGRDRDLQRILAESGFRRFVASPLRAYPGIEDYLALDLPTGRLVHLHLHFQLTLGERHLKSYRLPWEVRLLATRRFDRIHHVYIADAALELLLLLVRAALKHRLRDPLLKTVRRRRSPVLSDFARELSWLRQQVDDLAVREVARSLLGAASDRPLQRLLAAPLETEPLAAFAAAIRPGFNHHRTYGRREALLRAWMRELQCGVEAVNRRYLHRATPLRRVSPRGGTVIVLLGSDGAGKSTLAQTLAGWLGVKLDVVPIYFGSGDGPSAFYRWPMRLAYRLLAPAFGRAPTPRPAGEDGRGVASRESWRHRLRAAARVPWAIALACEKRGKLRRLIRARNRGMVVVCDRYPQSEFPGFNDGPLLARWREHPSPFRRAVAAWEARSYAQEACEAPDVVIKLIATPTVAQVRRPEMSLAELNRRVAAVRGLQFPPRVRVVELDAHGTMDDVALKAKAIVWDYL